MPILRRFLLVLVAVAAVAGFASSRALALPPPSCNPGGLDEVVSSAHFDVYYTADPGAPNLITQTQASNIAALSEQAYAAYKALGFPAPMDDGSGVGGNPGRIPINVIDLSPWSISSYICWGGWDFGSAEVDASDEAYTAGADLFAEIQNNIFIPTYYSDNWLGFGAAAWASWKALGYPAVSTFDLGPFDMSLDCYDSGLVDGSTKCSKVPFENGGDSRWPFYEYLAERFGVTFIDEVFQDANTVQDSLQGLTNALVAHGTTLPAVYDAFATKMMAGGWTAPSLNVAALPISGEPVMTGTATGDLSPLAFNVDHLATKYVEIDRGDGAADHPCFAATLTITVQIPSGVTSQPAFFWNGGTTAVDLAVSGSTATTTVPWDTCNWTQKGFLSLPNATSDLDSKQFIVSEHLNVDTNTPATAKVPPAPSTPFGSVINVPAAGQVPAISVFGPELLTLSAGATQIRLIIESSGEGSVSGALGGVGLGKASLRPGENDVRFTVPVGTLATLRSTTAAGAMILSLTPTSLDGKATGPAVKQQISVAPVTKSTSAKKPTSISAKAAAQAKAKAKAKAAATAKAKAKKKKGH